MGNLNTFLQFIDPPLLEHHLLSSLWYSSFPPLYNLVAGVMLKLFGASPGAFAVLQLMLGWALGLVIHAMLADLGVGRRLAVIATMLVLISPPIILYENWLFYTSLETLLFTLTAWSFMRFAQKPAACWSLAVFSSCTALALLNARMMLLLPMVALFIHHLWRGSGQKTAMACSAVLGAAPVLLVFAVMAKNAFLFGAFTIDPHFGFHMGNGFIYEAWSDAETHQVCERDFPILLIPPTQFPDAEKAGVAPPAKTGVALLDEPTRSAGAPNFQSRYFLAVSSQYSDAIKQFVTAHPGLYLRFVWRAFKDYWLPSDEYIFWRDGNTHGFSQGKNLQTLAAYCTLYDAAYPLLLLIYCAGAVGAAVAGWRTRWRDARNATLAFALAIVGYNMLAVFVTLGENNRYKAAIEPLLWAAAVCALDAIMRARRRNSAAEIPA